MRRLKCFQILLLLITFCYTGLFANEIIVKSPDKKLVVKVLSSDGRLSYSIQSGATQVIKTSPLGLMVDSTDLGMNPKIGASAVLTKINEKYPILGNHTTAYNRANEANIPIEASGKKYSLIVRVYNDGAAIRYSIPDGAKRIDRDFTSWALPDNTKKIAWSALSQCYEAYSYVTTPDKVSQDKAVMGPITIETNSHFISISEADCEDFSDMAFVWNGNSFQANFPYAKKGWEIKRLSENNPAALQGLYNGQKVSPWRTIIVANNLTELVNSDLLTNLCPAPAKGADFSYVKPGRCLWQWWSVGSPKYDDQKNWYDAAAKLKWEYYLVDDGWRYWKQGEKDQWTLLKEVIDYGNSVGVKSIIWADSKEFRKAKERRAYLEKVKAIGAVGIKIDFIPDATSEIMQWYMGTMYDCAELKLLLNFHGSVKPTGLTRTYPNDITREAVRGNEYHMTRYRRVMPLDQDVSLPFTRPLAGAADFTPVILNPKELTSAKYTWPHEFAQAIVYLSPITHFCDQYSFYLESPMLDLFQTIPTVWDETRVLPCTSMGEVVAYARRKGNTWWIGVMNGTAEREIKISLDFLKKATKASLVYDGAINTSIDRREQNVSPNEVLTIKMAPGGGFVARF